MSIKLNELVIENFNSFLGRHTLSFKEKQGNLVLIKGLNEIDKSSNGSGKSSIVDAIVFALYGRSLKKELNLDDIVCDKSKDPMKIELSFVDSSDGVVKSEYRIKRTRSMSPAFTKCELFENGTCISKNMTNTETQTKIETIIGLDYPTFCNNNVLNPELFKFIKSNSASKIEVLERVLNLNVVAKIFAVLTNAKKEDEDVHQKNDKEFYAIKSSLESVVTQADSVTRNIDENIDILENQLVSLTIEKDKFVAQRDMYSNIVNDLFPEVVALNETIDAENSNKIKLEQLVATHKKNAEYYKKNEKCHACKQVLPNRDVQLIFEEHEAARFTKMLVESIEKINVLKNNEIFEKYNDAVQKADNCTSNLTSKNSAIEQVKKNIARWKAMKDAPTVDVEELTAKFDAIKQQFDSSKENLEITDFWRELIVPKSKVRMAMASDLLKILNFNIQKYINNFYNQDFHMNFTATDKDIVESITVDGRKKKYDQLSSGEKQKVDIVIVLSLLDIAMTYFKNNKLKFLIIDEATDHLDNVWARYVVEFIKQYAIKLNMMVLLISHHSVIEELDSVFDNTIVAVKGLDGNSYLPKSRVH